MFFRVLSFALVLCSPIFAEEKMKEVRHEVSVEKTDTHFNVTMGSQPAGTHILLTLDIKNNTGGDLDLVVGTSCSCTKTSEGNVKAKDGENMNIVVKFDVTGLGENSAKATFIDAEREFTFDVSASYTSHIPVVAETTKHLLKTQESGELLFKAKSLFPFVKITKLSVEGSNIVEANTVDSDSINIKFLSTKGILNDAVYITATYFDSELEEEKTSELKLDVDYSGVIAINPSTIRLRNLDGVYKGFCLINGIIDEVKNEDIRVWLEGPTKVECKIESLTSRNERVKAVKILVENLDPKSEYKLVVDCGNGIVATSKVQVSE